MNEIHQKKKIHSTFNSEHATANCIALKCLNFSKEKEPKKFVNKVNAQFYSFFSSDPTKTKSRKITYLHAACH